MQAITRQQAQALAALADTAFEHALKGTHGAKPTGEVSAVRAVIEHGFPELALAWDHVLAPLGLRVELTTIFVHGAPYVKFTACNQEKRRELADLLVVVDECPTPGQIKDRRAVLIQAKRLKGKTLKLHGLEFGQFELLSQWPPFEFVNRKLYADRIRKFGDPTASDSRLSGEYGTIDLTHSTWTQEFTQIGLPCQTYGFEAPISLGGHVAGMLAGTLTTGRPTTVPPSDEWSLTVDELMRVTHAQQPHRSTQAALGFTSAKGSTAASTVNTGGFRPGQDAQSEDEWPEGPISLAHLKLTTRDGRDDESRVEDVNSGWRPN